MSQFFDIPCVNVVFGLFMVCLRLDMLCYNGKVQSSNLSKAGGRRCSGLFCFEVWECSKLLEINKNTRDSFYYK